jgi:hypothetical protein
MAQRYPGVECGGDEAVAQRVRPDPLGDASPLGQPPDYPGCGVPGQALAFVAQEDRSLEPLTDRQVQRSGGSRRQRDGDGLGSFAVHHEGSVASLEAELFDVGAEGFRDPQPVQREQRAQRVVLGRRQSGLDEEDAELVAVKTDGVGLVVEFGRRTCTAGECSMTPSSVA